MLYTALFALALLIVISLIFIFFNPTGVSKADLPLDTIKLPAGFKIEAYADDVPGARSMTMGTNGTLFVGSRDEGKVYAITSKDGRKADEVIVIASGLKQPNGVAFRNGSLYVAEVSRILRYDNIEANLKSPPQPVVVSEAFPTDEWHGWKFIAFGPDGKLYVPVGAPCNICERPDPYATIMRITRTAAAWKYTPGAYGIRWASTGTLTAACGSPITAGTIWERTFLPTSSTMRRRLG
jgi:glucose/arabinose dehydrogenase